MYCRKCGANNADDAASCHSCGEQLRPAAAAPSKRIQNYLVLSIVVTVLCCMPLGIPAIVHAAQVNARAQLGDIAGAEIYSRKARMWAFWALGIGFVFYAGYALLMVFAIMADPAFRR